MSLTVRVRPERRGSHLHCQVFVGPDADHLALSGTLVFAESEAEEMLERFDWMDAEVEERAV